MHTDEGFDFDEAKELGFNIVEIEIEKGNK